MIKLTKKYTILCDRCGDESNEYPCWETKDEAIEYSKESGWIETNGKHYCEDCKDEIEVTL